MNNLKQDKKEAVIRCLVEGASVRATERLTGVHRDTILRLMVRVGTGCERLMDAEFRRLSCKRIQIDEIWGRVGKSRHRLTESDDPNRNGDFFTFVAIDADTRLVPAYKVGKRTVQNAIEFLTQLSGRMANRIQLSSDGWPYYASAIDQVFGTEVDYAQIVKSYEAEPIGPGRYAPPRVSSVAKKTIVGNPDLRHASTSYVERSNLLMRMSIRRLTRLTDAASRKPENLAAAVSLHFAYYNFVRLHQSIRATPAMAAGVTNHIWDIADLLQE